MAWNTCRITLIAPGWQGYAKPSDIKRTAKADKPVTILQFQRINPALKTGPPLVVVQEWLQASGFKIAQECPPSVRFLRDNIEALVTTDDSEVVKVLLTFILSAGSFSEMPVWDNLIQEMCTLWGFRLFDPEEFNSVECSEFFRLLSQTPTWKEFEAHFGWQSSWNGEEKTAM